MIVFLLCAEIILRAGCGGFLRVYNLLMPRQKRSFGVKVSDPEILAAALVGFEHKRSEIEEKMAELRRRLGGGAAPVPKKRTMSAAARRRIGAAQRKRWAAVKKAQVEKVPSKAAKKRTMSAAARKRIGEATRKRWAELRKKKGATG
jgi:hypothetical protein